MKRFLRVLCWIWLLLSFQALAENLELPNSDITVFTLQKNVNTWSISQPVIAACSPGYDNQPCFDSSSPGLYFTRIENGTANIWRWTAGEGERPWATSPLSEYSPTLMPNDPGRLSIVRVEEDQTQRLWSYQTGAGFELLFESIQPIGYHAWSDSKVALFVLGQPHQLRVTQLGQETTELVDSVIGRCLQKIPGRDAVSYTVEEEKQHRLKSYDFETGKVQAHRLLPGNSQDYAWLDSKTILTSDGETLYIGSLNEGSAWQRVENNSGLKLYEISRLAISANGKKLAIVHVTK